MPPDAFTELLVEQEVAIDRSFRVLADQVSRAVRASGNAVEPARIGKVVGEEIARMFGSSPGDALDSEIGRLVRNYANSARLNVISNGILDEIADRGAAAVRESIKRSGASARVLREVSDYLDQMFPFEEIGTGVRQTSARGLTAARRWTPETARRLWTSPPIPPDMSDEARRLVRSAFYEMRKPRFNEAVTRRYARAILQNPAARAQIVATGRVPLLLDNTARWTGPDGAKLSDRLWQNGRRVRSQIEKRVQDAYKKGIKPDVLARDLERYLTADYRPRRGKDGRLLRNQRPGVLTRGGRGKGSYPARRLARHELAKAHGETVLLTAATSEITPAVRWKLSAKHVRPDQCDENASRSSPGLPSGVYFPEDTPSYPNHIGDLCSLDAVRLDGTKPRR